MRFEKMKTTAIGSLAGSLSHTLRSRYTPNADPELTKNNRVLLGPETTHEVADAIRARWPDKHRKDAVGVIEHFIGASPEFFKKHGGDGDEDAYFAGAIEWLKSHYGEENVISVVQHNDETSPHLAAYVVPRDLETGRLNAKKWTGGRGACAAMQTSFQAFAGEPVGLERGVRGSKAEHTSIARWYAGQTDLDQRARTVRFDEADIVAREVEISEDQEQIETRTRRLNATELDQQRRGHELDDKQDQQAATVAAERRSLAERAQALDQRESSVQALSGSLGGREADVVAKEADLSSREHRLARLQHELSARGDKLTGGEQALSQRQAEIEHAGAVLQRRLNAASASQRDFEQKKASWIESTRPPAVPPLVRQLQHMQTLHTPSQCAEYLDEQDSDALYDAFDPRSGITARGEAVLAQYAGTAEKRQRWERDIEPPSSPTPGR